MAEAPQVPGCLKISFETWVAMLTDPVMAAAVLFWNPNKGPFKLDAFQRCRLRDYWWYQLCDDSSGVGSGKTVVIFIFLALRSILIPDHRGAIYYPTFGTGKNEFWNYFAQFVNPASDSYAPLFASQLGNPLKVDPGDEIDGDGTTHGPDCYKAFFRNGNYLLMPATNAVQNMKNSASLSFNTLVIEETRLLDAMSDGVDEILLDRARRYSWNQFHPVWGNHILHSGHAETWMHPSAKRYKFHRRRVMSGDPTYGTISFSFKDYSNLPCDSKGRTFRQKFRSQLATGAAAGSATSASWLAGALAFGRRMGMAGLRKK